MHTLAVGGLRGLLHLEPAARERQLNMNAALPRNALWMVISRLGTQALTVVFTVFLARRLGVDGFGRYAFITTLIFIANAVTTFGTDMLLIREIAASNDLSRLGPALGL